MSITVDQLYTKLTHLIRTNGLGLLELDGTLHDWTIRRGNIATGDLTTTTARLRIYANQHATRSAIGDLADAGFDGSRKIPVTAIGHLVVDPKWGLQLDLKRLRPHHAHTSVDLGRPAPNADLAWPATITTIGLIAPAGGDDALADVHAHLDAGIATIEHRVAFTGPRAVINIIHALDRLALDPRPDVTLLVRGGGPTADFAPFDDPLVLTAIDRHRHPIVTGLGHATNTTAADHTVHTSCATPTAAVLHLRARRDVSRSDPSASAADRQAPPAYTRDPTDRHLSTGGSGLS